MATLGQVVSEGSGETRAALEADGLDVILAPSLTSCVSLGKCPSLTFSICKMGITIIYTTF